MPKSDAGSREYIETVLGTNPWRGTWTGVRGEGHSCYFCRPEDYPPMPSLHTLCARCGQFIFTPQKNDPMNERMAVCERCETELGIPAERET